MRGGPDPTRTSSISWRLEKTPEQVKKCVREDTGVLLADALSSSCGIGSPISKNSQGPLWETFHDLSEFLLRTPV
eukprot:scaffold5067_cov245-Pinguiococcus_pyrenoidosus.AAC.9